jgi:hypothetical protein
MLRSSCLPWLPWMTQMTPAASSRCRIWFVGHSDGSSLAQLAALRAANIMGVDKIGGIFLFGAQRVGSVAFAKYYNSQLGTRTHRFQYGRDPATELMYTKAQGLKLTGRGYVACPMLGRGLEKLVQVPLGQDWAQVCNESLIPATVSSGHLTDQAAAASLVLDNEQAAGGTDGGQAAAHKTATTEDSSEEEARLGPEIITTAVPGAGVLRYHTSGPPGSAVHAVTAIASNAPAQNVGLILDYLAHHFPSVFFDGLMRVLKNDSTVFHQENCSWRNLALQQCVVSDKCAAALRPGLGSRDCQTCGDSSTCRWVWGSFPFPYNRRCDNANPKSSGNLCYEAGAAPPGLLKLLGVV